MVSSLLLLLPTGAMAEGTDELMPTVGAAGRLGLVDADVVLHADIVEPADEVLCVVGQDASGDPVTFDVVGADGATVVTGAASDGGCVGFAGRPAGAYRVQNFSRAFTSTRRWDLSVCDSSRGACDASAGNPAHVDGRIFAFRWVFNSTPTQSEARAVSASVYARVPIGRFGLGVVELQLGGVHGLARWELLANGSGIDGVNPSRSTGEGRTVATEYPIYFNPPDPAVAAYGVPDPQIADFVFTASGVGEGCGAIEPGRNLAAFEFDVNMPGRVRLLCDLDGDGNFDASGADDLVLNGEAEVGGNRLEWDGTSGGGDVAAGTYDCLVELSAGEFHYVAEDIEVAYPGLRMFQVSPSLVRTPLPMFWNDSAVVPDAPITMPNGDVPVAFSPEGGLSAGPYTDGASAHGMSMPGNARGWGTFTTSGSVTGSRGDRNLMDTWTSLDTVRSGVVSVRVFGRDADCDGTGGTDLEEVCVMGTDPCACDSDAECDDGIECTQDRCDGTACVATPLPARTSCAGGLCDGQNPAMCVMCLETSDCPTGTVCTDTRCVGDDDDMDTLPNAVECPELASGGDCVDRDGDGMVDYLDPDDDNDGLLTRDEVADGAMHGNDVDGDGTLNWHDTDADDDGLLDADEGRGDDDGDGVPNYLDPASPVEPPAPMGGFGISGGACSVGQRSSGAPWAVVSLFLLVAWARRRSARAV
ncbi:MAG: hypothetical protein AB8I08_03030 [Sandaracinaceae bacterium]